MRMDVSLPGSLLLGAGNIGLNLNWEDIFQLLNQLCTKLLQNDKTSMMSSVTTTATVATQKGLPYKLGPSFALPGDQPQSAPADDA